MASEPTVCYIGFDNENLYISVISTRKLEVLAKVHEQGCTYQGG